MNLSDESQSVSQRSRAQVTLVPSKSYNQTQLVIGALIATHTP